MLLLDTTCCQLALQKTVNVAGTLVVKAGGVALQPLVGVGVNYRCKCLFHRDLRLVIKEQQGEILHHVEFNQFFCAHNLFKILMARSVPK